MTFVTVGGSDTFVFSILTRFRPFRPCLFHSLYLAQMLDTESVTASWPGVVTSGWAPAQPLPHLLGLEVRRGRHCGGGRGKAAPALGPVQSDVRLKDRTKVQCVYKNVVKGGRSSSSDI